MDQKDLDYFKDVLTQWLDELLGKAGTTVVGLLASDVYFRIYLPFTVWSGPPGESPVRAVTNQYRTPYTPPQIIAP